MKIEFEINKEEIFTGWSSNSFLFESLITSIKPSTIIEVGTWKGGSAIHMADLVKDLKLNCRIYCVDTWLGATEFFTTLANTPERNLRCVEGYPTIYYQFLYNIRNRKHDDIIIPYPMTSSIAAKVFKYRKISADLIYIDGSHDYEDVKRDINDYYELLNPGGVMFGDNNSYFKGAQIAYREFIADKHKNETYDDFWIIRK